MASARLVFPQGMTEEDLEILVDRLRAEFDHDNYLRKFLDLDKGRLMGFPNRSGKTS